MKIGSEINISNVNFKHTQPQAPLQEQNLSVQDSINIGSSQPEPKTGKVFTTEQQTPAIPLERASACAPHTIAASAIPGAAAVVVGSLRQDDIKKVLDRLEEKQAKFYQERNIHIPLIMGKHKQIGAEEAAEIISDGKPEDKQRLSVQLPNLSRMPIFDDGDVKELEAFEVTGAVNTLPHAELANFVNESIVAGLEFKTPDGDNIGAYGAYNVLTGGWQSATSDIKTVELNRNGVAILSLNKGKASDILALKQELKESWDAYNELEKNPKNLGLVAKEQPGASFAQKAQIFSELVNSEHSADDAFNAYSVIAKRTEPGENFTDVSARYFDLKGKLNSSTMETLQAFNYARTNLKSTPRLEKSFIEFYKHSNDINESIKAINIMATPSKEETFEVREKALLTLAQTAGKDAIQAYETASRNRLPGETVLQASEEFADLMKSNKNSTTDTANTQRAFEYMRTQLSSSPEEMQVFKSLYKQVADVKKTMELMETIKKPAGDSTFAERASLMTRILDNVYISFVNDTFAFVARNTLQGEKFADNANLMVSLLESQKNEYEALDTSANAYLFIKQELKGNQAEIEGFTKLLGASKRLHNAKQALTQARTDIPGSDFNCRIDALTKIINFTQFEDAYNATGSSLFPGETINHGIDQLLAFHKANRNHDNIKLNETAEKLAKVKKEHVGDQQKFDNYYNFVRKFEDLNLAKLVMERLDKPVRAESYEDRLRVQDDFLAWEEQAKGSKEDAALDYKTVVDKMASEETLDEAAGRFKTLLNMLKDENKGANARDAFTFISDEIAKGTFPGKSASEITKDLVKELLLSDNLKDAKEQLIYNSTPNNADNSKPTISQDDDYVIIGGIKLKKKKTA